MSEPHDGGEGVRDAVLGYILGLGVLGLGAAFFAGVLRLFG